MRKIYVTLLSVMTLLLASCGTTSTVPITGRQQTLLVSDGEVLGLANQQYQEFMKTAKLSTNATNTAMVRLTSIADCSRCLTWRPFPR